MADLETSPIDTLYFNEGSAPSTPASGSGVLYVKTDGVYFKGDDGTEVGPFAAAGEASLPTLVADKVKLTTGNLTTTSTSFGDATGLSITVTTGARRCLVTFSASVFNNTDNQFVYLELDIDGTDQGAGGNGVIALRQSGANKYMNGSFSFLTDVLTAAEHTFKIQWRVGGGTGTIVASTTDAPAILSVQETLLAA